MESPDRGHTLLHSLNAVVSWLHSEGFYAAEETLLREIENRYPAPDALSPRHISSPATSEGPAAGGGGAAAAAAAAAAGPFAAPAVQQQAVAGRPRRPSSAALRDQEQQQQQQQKEQQQQQKELGRPPRQALPGGGGGGEDTVDFQPALAAAHSLTPVDSMESAEKVLEAWRSKSTTPAASPKKASALSPPVSPNLWSGGRGPCAGSGSDVDEWEGDDDPGYLRLDVVGQEAALGLELDQLSEHSAHSGGQYYALSQYDSGPTGVEPAAAGGAAAAPPAAAAAGLEPPPPPVYVGSAAHARHSSIDMGLLNRQLHGGSSASSSLHGRAKARRRPSQQGGAAQPPTPPVLLSQPVTSGDHWRSASGSALLPPLVPTGAPSQAAAAGEGEALPAAEPEAAPRRPRRSGSPAGSSEAGGGSPDKRPDGSGLRGDSYAQRAAGTAQWVFDRANSADADAYRSLLHHLDRPSTGQSATPASQPPASPEGPPALKAASTPAPPAADESEGGPSLSVGALPRGSRAAGAAAGGGGGEEVSSPLLHQASISRVSSLGESMLQEAAALCLADTPAEQAALGPDSQQPAVEEAQPLLADGGAGEAAPPADAAQEQEQQQEQQQQQRAEQSEADEELLQEASAAVAEPADFTPQRPMQALPALRVGGPHGLGRHTSVSTAADTTAADRGSEFECGSPHGSSAHTPDGASIIDYSDPFSFPVTPPSEVPPPPDPAPLFGSWASIKSSPDRKSGLGYGTEDESTPARRRYQQRAAAAAVAAAAAAKEAGGVQRSIKFPPLGAAAPGMLRASGSSSQLLSYATPLQPLTDDDASAGPDYDQEYFDGRYEVLNLRVIHRRHSTGFEQARELPLHIDDLIAGRYQIVDLLGQAAFSRAVQALDLKTGALVCLKIIKNNKDYFDQGLDEVKLLRYVNAADPGDEAGILRLFDFFYFKEHLVLVTELLRANLYEFQKYNRESGDAPYFTLPRIQSIARQVLTSLAFLHSLGLVHADLKPENILVKSYSRCQVKVIDLGSSCFVSDRLSGYVQSRSYRAPEVILGLPYGPGVDMWSLGCILAELATGRVLFQNDSVATLLARLEGILGPLPRWMLHRGRYAHRYYARDGRLFEKNPHTGRYEFLRPKATSLARRVPQADDGMLAFLRRLLQPDPSKRPSAAEALAHPWLQQGYYAGLPPPPPPPVLPPL